MKRRVGFTLLELVISCTILIGLFSTLTMILTRAHRLRADSETRTRLLTEGRSLLDRLEAEIRHTNGTNLTAFAGTGGDELDFSFVRAKDLPRGTDLGEASTNIPFERVTYRFDLVGGNTTGGFHKTTSTWNPSAETAGRTNYATVYRFIRKDGTDIVVTNVHSAKDKVVLPGGKKGDTISLPVTSGSSKRIYDTIQGTAVHVDIVETESPLTNRVLATVTFTNAFSSVVSNSIRRPPAIPWPSPGEEALLLERDLGLFSETRTNSCPLLPLAILYTNTPSALAVTNAFAYTNAPASTSTNRLTGIVTTNAPAPWLPSTNIIATTRWALTNLQTSATGGTAPLYPQGIAAFLTTAPIPRTNLWMTATPSPGTNAPTAGDVRPLPPAIAPGGNASTNRPGGPGAGTTDQAGNAPTNRPSVPGFESGAGDAFETLHPGLIQRPGGEGVAGTFLDGFETHLVSDDAFSRPRPLPVPVVSTNLLRDLVPPMVFDNRFVPNASPDGPPLPLAFYRRETVRGPADPVDLLCETTDGAVLLTLAGDGNRAVLRSLRVERHLKIDLRSASETNGPETNFTTVCSARFHSVATFRFEMEIPATLAGTNRYEYLQDDSKRIWTGTSRSEDTTWETIVLEEDLPETAVEIPGLWLEEGKRDGRELEVEKTELYRDLPGTPEATGETDRPDLSKAIVGLLRFTPLSFRKDGDDLALVEWDPDDDEGEPPVCVDIHLEMLAPVHRKRAMSIPDGEKNADYVERHLLRLDRRVPLATRNLWRPPR